MGGVWSWASPLPRDPDDLRYEATAQWEGQKWQELDHGAQSFIGHSLLPPCSFPSGKSSQSPAAPGLSGTWVRAQSLMKMERALGGNPQ